MEDRFPRLPNVLLTTSWGFCKRWDNWYWQSKDFRIVSLTAISNLWAEMKGCIFAFQFHSIVSIIMWSKNCLACTDVWTSCKFLVKMKGTKSLFLLYNICKLLYYLKDTIQVSNCSENKLGIYVVLHENTAELNFIYLSKTEIVFNYFKLKPLSWSERKYK